MNAPLWLVPLPVVVPLVAAGLALTFARRPRLQAVISVAALTVVLGVAIALLFAADAGPLVVNVGEWSAPVGIALVVDRLAAVMLVLTAALAFPAILYATERWEKAGPHFHSLFQFLLVGLNGAFLTGDLFNLFVLWIFESDG